MSQPDTTARAPQRVHLLILVGLGCLGILLYSNTLDAPFVFDDAQNITGNRMIRVTSFELDALRRAAFDSYAPRPVANLSFALNYALGGYDVRGFHLFNIAVHLLCGFLVYALGLRVYRDAAAVAPERASAARAGPVLPAVAAAALFLAHPIQIQAVTYIVQRMTSLSVLFCLATMILYLVGRDAAGTRRTLAWTCAVACWLLAMGSKQIAAPLPFLILLYEWAFRRDLSRDWLRNALPVGALALLAVTVMGILFTRGLALSFESEPFDMGERVLTQLRVIWIYLSLVVLPTPGRLNIVHEVAISRSLVDPVSTLIALAGLLGLLGLAVAIAQRERLLSYCIIWFFATLALESSVLPLELMYEHRLYLPMVGLTLGAAELIFRPFGARRAIPSALTLVLVGALGTATLLRNEHWRDAVTLWADAASKSPGQARVMNNLAHALEKSGDLDGAIEHYQRATEIDPSYPRAQHNLAIALQLRGNLLAAQDAYARALVVAPRSPRVWFDFGTVLEASSRPRIALEAYRRAIEVGPWYTDAHRALGILAAKQGLVEQAMASLAVAAERRPGDAGARHALGILLDRQGDHAGAAELFREVVRIQPGNPAAHLQLAVSLRNAGALDESEAVFREASRIDPNNPQLRAAIKRLRGEAP